jgi:phage gpG-like protein
MAQAFTSYEIDNDRKFRNAIARASEVTDDLRVPFGLILRDFYKSEGAIFKLQGPGKYPPFQGHKDADGLTRYQAYKRKRFGFDYPLLVATGRLANSLLGPSNPGSISKITKLSLTFGTSVPYGVYHQSDEPRHRMPLRKFLFIGPEAPSFATSEQMGRAERWLNIMNDYVLKQIAKETK